MVQGGVPKLKYLNRRIDKCFLVVYMVQLAVKSPQILCLTCLQGAIDLSWDVTSSSLLTALQALQGSIGVGCRDPTLSK